MWSATFLANLVSGAPGRPTEKECIRGHQAAIALVGLDPLLGVLGGDGGDDRGVDAAGDEQAVGHVGHELALHRVLEGLPEQRRGRPRPWGTDAFGRPLRACTTARAALARW